VKPIDLAPNFKHFIQSRLCLLGIKFLDKTLGCLNPPRIGDEFGEFVILNFRQTNQNRRVAVIKFDFACDPTPDFGIENRFPLFATENISY
jgi:hypothetical protein